MITASLAEEKRTTSSDTEGDTSPKLAFYARNNCYRLGKDKEEIKCYYCKKLCHITWNCKQRTNDVLKGKVRDKQHMASALMIEELPDVDSSEEITEENGFYAF